MALITCQHTNNYFEFVLLPNSHTQKHDTFDVYDYSFTKDAFYNVMDKFKNTKYKPFEKQHKEYIYEDLCLENYDNKELKLYKKHLVSCKHMKDFVVLGYNRTKQSVVNFPSTLSIASTRYVKRLIFRISNRVYVNFETSIPESMDTITYCIYVNYNHDENVDLIAINRDLQNALMIVSA